jgi:hypothetical protein
MARPKKTDPELLLVSFCDILTISISGLFMATIVTVFEATKIPELRMTPRAIPTTKAAVFFECRNNQLYYVDKEGLDQEVTRLLSTLSPGIRGGELSQFLKVLQAQEVGNQYYKVDPRYLLVGRLGLEAREGVPGEPPARLESPNSIFQTVLRQLDPETRYVAFLVRDDSFDVFRKAREMADRIGFDTGWELLGIDEPIKFGEGGTVIATQ